MTPTSVITLTIFFVLVLEASGQLAGLVGSACAANHQCLDNASHVCDTSSGSPLCKIRAGKFCGRQKMECVSGASCQSDLCVCAAGLSNSGLCPRPITPIAKAENTTTAAAAATTTTTTTTTTATTITTTTEEADDKTDSSQSARKQSGAVTWTRRGFSHVIQLLAAMLLCLLSP